MSNGSTTVATDPINDDPLLDKEQVQRYANLTPRTTRLLFEERRVPTVKIGRRLLVKKSDLDAHISANTRPVAAEKIAAYIERVVAEAPPLTETQRSRLAALLTAASPAPPRTVRRPLTVDEVLADAPDHIALVSAPGGDAQ